MGDVMVFKVGNFGNDCVDVLVRNVNDLCIGCFVVLVGGGRVFVDGDCTVVVDGDGVFVYRGDVVNCVFKVGSVSAVFVE